MTSVLNNPLGANRTVTTFVSGKDADGIDLYAPTETEAYRANATITKGQALSFVVPTATVPVSVTPMAAATDDRMYVGVALDGAAAGDTVLVATRGLCLVKVVDDTPAAGDHLGLPDTTTGSFETTATDPDATAIVGKQAGVVLGTKDSNNLCLAYLRQM